MARSNRIDKTDIAIIKSLQRDGRRPYAKIASELNLAPSTIQQRAHRLMDRGLLKVRAVTDPVALGVPLTATIALKADGTRMGEIAAEVGEFDEVGWVAICAGSYDILIEIACKDNEHLMQAIAALSQVEGVRSTETFIYLRIVKNTFQWGVPFNDQVSVFSEP